MTIYEPRNSKYLHLEVMSETPEDKGGGGGGAPCISPGFGDPPSQGSESESEGYSHVGLSLSEHAEAGNYPGYHR